MHLSRRKNHSLIAFWKISVSRDWRDSNKRSLLLPKKKEWRMLPASWTLRAQLVTLLVPSRLLPKSCSAPQSQLLLALISKTKQTRFNKSCRLSNYSQLKNWTRVVNHSKVLPLVPKKSQRLWASAKTSSAVETSQLQRKIFTWTKSMRSSTRVQKALRAAIVTQC